MPMTVDDYLDKALPFDKHRSDNGIGRSLGVSHGTVNSWRMKRSWPTDEAMIALADLIGHDRSAALMDLNSWRTKSVEAKSTYRQLAKRLTKAAAALSLVVGISATSLPGTDQAQAAIHGLTLYIM